MDLRTKLIYQHAKKRIKEIAQYQDKTEEIQLAQLLKLFQFSEGTDFALRHGLTRFSNYQDFRRNVPLRNYNQYKEDIERMIKGEENILIPQACTWFAKSSGTTNDKSKFIPVPSRHLKSCHYQGGRDSLWIYLRNNPESKFFRTKSLVLGGSHRPSTLNSRSRSGDLSSILVEHMPSLGKIFRVPSRKVLLMDEWIEKLNLIIEEIREANIGSLSGVPSWMLVLLKKTLEATGRENICELWPNLEVFFHGGISFTPYRESFKALIPKANMHYEETYNASEGFFGIQDDPSIDAMLLMLDYGVFFEFIPLEALQDGEDLSYQDEAIKPLWEVEVGQNYALILSSLGGLYRYVIGDTVRFISNNPYRFIITGRTKQYINAFGEEVIVDNSDKALKEACQKTGASIADYTVAPQFFTNESQGRHQWLIEFEQEPQNIDAFTKFLDQALQSKNSDYEAKRYQDMTLLPLEVIPYPKGLFHEWLARQGKLGGQHKVPRLANSRAYMDQLLTLLEEHRKRQV